MAELSTVARPYAQALFEAVRSGDGAALDGWSAVLAELAELVALDGVREALSDPRLGNARRSELLLGLLEAAKGAANKGVANKGAVKKPSSKATAPAVDASAVKRFVDLLLENGRVLALAEIADQFEQLKNQLQGTALAQIASAFPMDGAQLQPLLAALEKKFGLRLKPDVTVDANLIGGVRVVVGDQVLDTSVRAQLGRMQDALAAA